MPLVFAILLLVLAYLSLHTRISLISMRTKRLPEDTKPSWMSEALKGLVGTAGGIYLSFHMLLSFLGITAPERIALGGVKFDPLALVSLFFAIIQPFFEYFLTNLKW